MKRYLLALAIAVAGEAQTIIIGGSGGGGGGSTPPYEAPFSAATGVSVTAATHGQGTKPVVEKCEDDATPKALITAGYTYTTAANGDLVISWTGSKTGVCYISAGKSGTPGVAGTPGPINTIRFNGSDLPQRAAVNLVGVGVACADDPGNGESECAFAADVIGGSALTVAERIPRIVSAGTLGQSISAGFTGSDTTERLQLYNTSGATGFDLRVGGAQGASTLERILANDGTTVLERVSEVGERQNSVALSVLTSGTLNASMRPTTGVVAANNRGFCWSSTTGAAGTPDTCMERPSAGTTRITTSLAGARGSLEALNINLTGTGTFARIAGAAIGLDVLAYSANVQGYSTKPAPSGTVVGTTDTQTLTNKTLTSPVVNTPTGIVKGDVGLGNVDNTSDATKNAATATLTNKTLTTPVITSYTVATRPAAGTANRVIIVTDAATTGDCDTGGGTSRAWCRDTGSIWEPLGDGGSGGAGGADLITEINSSQQGQQPRLNLIPGEGMLITGSESAPRTNITIAGNDAVWQKRSNDIENGDKVVTLSSSGTDTFVGTTGVSFPAYPSTVGMQVILKTNNACSGANTLALNSLAAKNNYEADGTTNMTCASGDVIVLIWDPALNGGAGGWRKSSGGGAAPSAFSNGYYATLPFHSSYLAVTQTGGTTIQLMRINLGVGMSATKLCVWSANASSGGITRVGLYSIAAGSGTASKIGTVDSGDLTTATVATAPVCGTFGANVLVPGSYFLAWAVNQATVGLMGQNQTISAGIKAWWQSGPEPVIATCGTWAGAGNALPATCTVDTSTTPTGMWPWINLF